ARSQKPEASWNSFWLLAPGLWLLYSIPQERSQMPNSKPRKIGVFPGQFDPITNGHLDVIKRGVTLFDELIVAVGVNPDKRELFTLDERVEMIGELLKNVPHTKVAQYTGLTADFVRKAKAT